MTAVDLSQHYQSGPWILVAERETGSELLLSEIDRQCKARGVYLDIYELDNVDPRTLFRYKGMILLPAPVKPPAEVDPAVLDRMFRLIKAFRVSYPWGVRALVGLGGGHASWHEVGVVQLVADATVFTDSIVRAAINSGTVCGHLVVGAGKSPDDLDIFALYAPDDATLGRRSSQTAMELQGALDHLRSWNMVVSVDSFDKVRALIAKWIEAYDGKRYKKVPGSPHNLLQWVIDDPDTDRPTPELAAALEDEKFHATWKDGTQRAARNVLDDLLATYGIERPWKNGLQMHGKKGQRRALSKLVATMNQIDDLLGPELGAGSVVDEVLSSPGKQPVAVNE